jgi:hypothetical protein
MKPRRRTRPDKPGRRALARGGIAEGGPLGPDQESYDMISVPGQRAARPARRGEAIALWAGLAVAFSPTLLDLVRHMAENPWARYAALFPFLFARCAFSEPERPPERRDGYLWIGLGMGVELLGIFAGATRIGRVGLALAAIGLCRRFAMASWPTLILLVLAVPLPSIVLRWISPGAENALSSVASGGLGALGLGIEFAGTRAFYGSQEFVLERFDSGGGLVPLLAGLSWYHSLLLGTPARAAALRAAAAALLAIPVQIAAIAFALLTLPLEAGAAGRLALTHLPWMAVAAVGLATTEVQFRLGGPAHEQ